MDEDDFLNFYFRDILGKENFNYEASGDYFNRKVTYTIIDENGNEVKGQFFVKTSYHSCPTCSKKRGNYFEAIIQLRGGRSKFEEVLKFVMEIVDDQDNSGIFITKIEKKREGYDLYISDREFSKIITKRIIERFGGSITESNSLVGRKEGRDLYRFTYAVRLPKYTDLDLIKLWGKKWLVSKMHGHDMILLNIENWDEIRVKLDDAEDGIILLHREDYRQADVLYSQDNSTYIISPFNYKEIAIRRIDNVKTILVGDSDGELVVIPPWIL